MILAGFVELTGHLLTSLMDSHVYLVLGFGLVFLVVFGGFFVCFLHYRECICHVRLHS